MINLQFNRTAANNVTQATTNLEVTSIRYSDTNDEITVTVGIRGYSTGTAEYTVNNISLSGNSAVLTFPTGANNGINNVRVGDTVTAVSSTSVAPVFSVSTNFNVVLVPGLDFVIAKNLTSPTPRVGESLVGADFAANTQIKAIEGNRFYLTNNVLDTATYSDNKTVAFMSSLRVQSIDTANRTVTLNRVVGGTGADITNVTFTKFVYAPALYTVVLKHTPTSIDNLNVSGTIYFEKGDSMENITNAVQVPVISPTRRGFIFGSSFLNIDEFLSAIRVPRINA